MFNPWHDLSLGSNAPHEIQVLIERRDVDGRMG